ncbi:MMPL family transporter, partial [Actinacidiphila alni]|uniref:MMPL family transporter n=1 Tax=Actinacidiphila alni TaxID=380248 RepID=UPI0015A71B82
MQDAVDRGHAAGLTVEIGGNALHTAPSEGAGVIVSVAIAALVLVLTFGSLVAAGLPLLTAAIGVGLSLAAIMALSSALGLPVSVRLPPSTVTSDAPTTRGAACGAPASRQSVKRTGPLPRSRLPSSPVKVVRTKCTGAVTGVCTSTDAFGRSKAQSVTVVGRVERADCWATAKKEALQPRSWAPSALITRAPAGSKVGRGTTWTFSSVRSVILVLAVNQEQTWLRTVIRLAESPHCAPELAMSIRPELPSKSRSCSYCPWVVNGLPPSSS